MIKHNSRAEYLLIQKLAAYFKIPKKDLFRDVKLRQGEQEEHMLVHSPLLEDRIGVHDHFYCCQETKKIDLNMLLFWDKFQTSFIYEQWLIGKGLVPENKLHTFHMTLHLKGTIWVISASQHGFVGRGGISIGAGQERFNIEPLHNFLDDAYGICVGR